MTDLEIVYLDAEDLTVTYSDNLEYLIICGSSTKRPYVKIRFIHDEAYFETEREFLEALDNASDEIGCEARRREDRSLEVYQKEHVRHLRKERGE